MKFLYPLCLLLFLVSLPAQSQKGIATYTSKTKMDLKLKGKQIPESMKASIMASLKNMSERSYTLRFDGTESVFSEEESLARPAPAAGGQNGMVFKMQRSKSVLYKNMVENRITREEDLFGKPFLIKDSLPNFAWKLGTETKKIGNYTCYKASYTMEVEDRPMGMTMSLNPKDEPEEKKDSIPMKTVEVVAWFTPQIPISNGPSEYGGLPGLILELNKEKTTYLCSQITLNPKHAKPVVEPQKGKVVTQKEYMAIMDKKIKEMNSQFGGKGRKGNSIRIEIKN